MSTSADTDRTAERARTWIQQRMLLAGTVTVTVAVAATAAGVLGTVLGPSLPDPAAKLRVAAGLGAGGTAVSAVWLARVAITALVVRANDLRPCEITELRAITHHRSAHTVLRIDTEPVPCSVEHLGDLRPGPALATRPAHWRVVVAADDRPRLASQPWTHSFGSMWNEWLASPETPDGPVRGGPWTTGRFRGSRRPDAAQTPRRTRPL